LDLMGVKLLPFLASRVPHVSNSIDKSAAGFLFGLLAIVGVGVVVAIAIVPSDTVLICRIVPQVQVAIRTIVTIWLVVPGTPKPPSRAICSFPSCLRRGGRCHGTACASTATVLGAGHIDDPMWASKLCGRADEGLPIFTRRRGEEFGACGAAVLLCGFADIQTPLALEQDAC